MHFQLASKCLVTCKKLHFLAAKDALAMYLRELGGDMNPQESHVWSPLPLDEILTKQFSS